MIAQLLFTMRLLVQRSSHLTALREKESSLLALTRRHEIALEGSSVGLWEMDLSANAFYADERMARLYGCSGSSECRLIDDFEACILPEDLPEIHRTYDAAASSRNNFEVRFRIRRRNDGRLRHIRSLGRFYGDGPRRKLVGLQQDITADMEMRAMLEEARARTEANNRDLAKAHAESEHVSLHDALSGLANRRYFDRVLSELDSEAQANTPFLLLHIDLDRFKQVNDTLGHAAGDAVLRETAKRIMDVRRERDFVARIGGDEFVVICRGAEPSFTGESLAKRLIDALSLPIVYQGHECRIGASIGIARRDRAGPGAEEVLANADRALYAAKRGGRNRFEIFNPARHGTEPDPPQQQQPAATFEDAL